METLLTTFPLSSLLLFLLLGCAVGLVAGLFGVGGGLIIVPALIWGLPLVGVNPTHATHIAVGTSLATIVVTSISAIRAHHKRGSVVWREVGLLAPGILIGAWFGGVVAGALDGDVLRRFYAGFALLVGLHMLLQFELRGHFTPGVWAKTAAGGVIGLISALVGIGGGTMTVPFLNAAGYPMRQAVASSSACGLPIAISGALSFIVVGWGLPDLPSGSSGFVYWPVALLIVLTSSLFAPLGAALAHRLPNERLKRAFGLFLLFVGFTLLGR